jgi:spore germination cell wall hydrolase CwlJ-like protein
MLFLPRVVSITAVLMFATLFGTSVATTAATGATIVPAMVQPGEPAPVAKLYQPPASPVTTTILDPQTIEAPRASLAGLVEQYGAMSPDDADKRCLATAVYFEAKSEPLAGQLAVARVILNRVKSGRFASSVCGVVTQRGQFSFVRAGMLPRVPANAHWRDAVGVAHVALKALYAKGSTIDALFFHARRVSPGWGKTALLTIGNHVFYR